MCLPLTSITKKQIIAVTGLLLILFIVGHLAGNLFIFGGKEAFNGYAHKLHSLGPLLLVIEYGLAVVFAVHISMTACVVLENIKSRGGLNRYAVDGGGERRSLATRIMPYTGGYIFIFVVWHIFDFKFTDTEGLRSVVMYQSSGIYGVVVNSFKDPLHSALYIIAMCFLGFHLAHGFQSCFQSMGINHPKITLCLKRASVLVGVLIAAGFSSIPVYVMFFLK